MNVSNLPYTMHYFQQHSALCHLHIDYRKLHALSLPQCTLVYMYILYSVAFFKNVFFYWLKGSKQPLVLLHGVKTLTITLRCQVSFSTRIGVLLPYSGYFSQDEILLWNHNQLYYGKLNFRGNKFEIHLLTFNKHEVSKLATIYTRDSRNRDVCQVVQLLWLWMHLLAAYGLVSIVQVGWLARDRVH